MWKLGAHLACDPLVCNTVGVRRGQDVLPCHVEQARIIGNARLLGAVLRERAGHEVDVDVVREDVLQAGGAGGAGFGIR